MNFKFLIIILICFGCLAAIAQTDTIVRKQSLSLSAGTSLPLGQYKQTSAGGGYANTGLAIQSKYTYALCGGLSAEANYSFFANGLNTDAIAASNKASIENQIGKEVSYSSASGNFWNAHNLMLGLNYKMYLSANKKLAANISLLGGVALVNTPASQVMASVNDVFYKSSSKRSRNITAAYQGLIGLSYQIKPKTSIVFNAGYIGMNLKGYNLEITDVGNNSYNTQTYKFEQKISCLNFTIGLATHF